jgi:hypothetical protein
MRVGSRSTSVDFRVILASVITPMALLAAVLVGSAIAAPPSPAPTLDHFRCYSNTGHPAAQTVTLEDQFDLRLGQTETVSVVWPIGFCNPVTKTIPGPGNSPGTITLRQKEQNHLTMYEIRDSNIERHPIWKVTVDNQFGRQTLFATRPVLLGVPTEKISVEGVATELGETEGLDHFKCYKARGQALNVAATLEDQFQTTDVVVKEPVLFCNPVEKTVGEEVTRIVDADAHLTCYNIDLATQIGFTTQIHIETDNQFNHLRPNAEPFTVTTDVRVLCVPSAKSSVLGMPGSFQAP